MSDGASIASATRAEQGLPPHVENDAVLALVAHVLNATNAGDQSRRSPKIIGVPAADNDQG